MSAVCPVSNSRATGLARAPYASHEPRDRDFVVGDQLSWSHPALQQADPETTVVILAEVREEASYVRHNRHKIALLFSAMRHFAEALQERGYQVAYYSYEESLPSLLAACERAQEQWRYERLLICEPGEYRLLAEMQELVRYFGCAVELLEDTRFLASRQDFQTGLRPQTAAHGVFLSRYAQALRAFDGCRSARGWQVELRCRQPHRLARAM